MANSSGCDWVTVVAANTRYPGTAGSSAAAKGAGVAGATNSLLNGAREVYLMGVQMTQPTVADAFEIVDAAGTTVTGLTWVIKDVSNPGPIFPGEGLKVDQNIGLKATILTAGVVNMYFRKLA